MTVFADTFAFLAWLNNRDSAAAKVSSYLNNYCGKLVTTEWVLIELADALSKPPAREVVVQFLQSIRTDPFFEVIGYQPDVFQAGMEIFSKYHDKRWSLTDCISFGVMTAHGVKEALTADHHFEQAGYVTLLK